MTTIGELTNVPEPGAPVASPWAQDVSSRVVHRFANFATLNAWNAPAGSIAQTMDDGMIWRATAGALPSKWSHVLPRSFATVGVILTVVGGQLGPLTQITVPADPSPRVLDVKYYCHTSRRSEPGDWTLRLNGTTVQSYRADNTASLIGTLDAVRLIHGSIQLAANTVGVVTTYKPNLNYVTFADPNFHFMTVTAFPGTVTNQVTPVPP